MFHVYCSPMQGMHFCSYFWFSILGVLYTESLKEQVAVVAGLTVSASSYRNKQRLSLYSSVRIEDAGAGAAAVGFHSM
jgi:hypothetical protein